MNYVAKTERRFDVVIVDSTDPQGPGGSSPRNSIAVATAA
jgi:spermidine synthase